MGSVTIITTGNLYSQEAQTSELAGQAELKDPDRDIETTTNLVLVTDPYGLFVKVSPSVKDYLGCSSAEIEGRLAVDFIHPKDLSETRDETRLIRRNGRPRHFYSRYIAKNRKPVELIWTGVWLPERSQFVFTGRKPRGKERLPFVHRVDGLDGFQVSKGLFALSLLLAYMLNIGSRSTLEVRHLIEELDGGSDIWAKFMAVYAVSCMVCLWWKHRWFQFSVSVISIFLWIWMGFVTLSSPDYAAASGIYEVMLGLASICVLYFRGRQL